MSETKDEDAELGDSSAKTKPRGFGFRMKNMTCFQKFRILFVRGLFFIHSLLMIWRVTLVLGPAFWIFTLAEIIYLFDTMYVLVYRGKEWTWFQAIVLYFLFIDIPCVWFLQLNVVSEVQVAYNHTAILEDLKSSAAFLEEAVGASGENATNAVKGLISEHVDVNDEKWTVILWQSIIVLILIARWFMPKVGMTNDQLSALLLSYLAIGSDIVDLFSILSENKLLLLDLEFVFLILSTWTWSMCQFIMIPAAVPKVSREDVGCCSFNFIYYVIGSEAWAIFTSIMQQDAPFCVVRLLCMFKWKIQTYTNYFFTAKNTMILTLQLNRLYILISERNSSNEDKSDSD